MIITHLLLRTYQIQQPTKLLCKTCHLNWYIRECASTLREGWQIKLKVWIYSYVIRITPLQGSAESLQQGITVSIYRSLFVTIIYSVVSAPMYSLVYSQNQRFSPVVRVLYIYYYYKARRRDPRCQTKKEGGFHSQPPAKLENFIKGQGTRD